MAYNEAGHGNRLSIGCYRVTKPTCGAQNNGNHLYFRPSSNRNEFTCFDHCVINTSIETQVLRENNLFRFISLNVRNNLTNKRKKKYEFRLCEISVRQIKRNFSVSSQKVKIWENIEIVQKKYAIYWQFSSQKRESLLTTSKCQTDETKSKEPAIHDGRFKIHRFRSK